jgi:glycerol dehydrogenase
MFGEGTMSTEHATRVFVSPGRYVQGVGVLDRIGEFVSKIGTHPLIIADDTVWAFAGPRVEGSLADAGLVVRREEFAGLATAAEITRLTAIAQAAGADVIVGLGGGSTIDTAKGVGHEAGVRWVSVPTTASTDAPGSGVAVIYTADGAVDEFRFFPHNPDLVLIDTQVVADAPVAFLIAGVGDAIATWLEARVSASTHSTTGAGGIATEAALAIAELSWNILWESALQAVDDVSGHLVTEAVERVVEANTLLSGLGFENAGLAAAHAIHDGLTVVPQTHGLQHGQKVNIGSIAQLILEGRPEAEIDEFIVFTARVGLPTSLTEVGLTVDDTRELLLVGDAATLPFEFIHVLPDPVTAQDVADALVKVEAASIRARAAAGLPQPAFYIAPSAHTA